MKKILVIDDDPEVLEIISDYLTTRKYAVVTSLYGSQTYELAVKHEPDLIILDIVLPDINGLEVLKTLKSKPITAFIPVILLTGQTAPTTQIKGLISGADDYITKPFNLDLLYARIVTALRRSLVFTRTKHDQFNLLRYLIGVYTQRGYECFTKLLDGYAPYPPSWKGFVPDLIATKSNKLKAILFETSQSILEESFLDRLNALVECRKNSTGKFEAIVIVRTKENYKVVKKLIEENQLEIEVKLFKKHLRREE